MRHSDTGGILLWSFVGIVAVLALLIVSIRTTASPNEHLAATQAITTPPVPEQKQTVEEFEKYCTAQKDQTFVEKLSAQSGDGTLSRQINCEPSSAIPEACRTCERGIVEFSPALAQTIRKDISPCGKKLDGTGLFCREAADIPAPERAPGAPTDAAKVPLPSSRNESSPGDLVKRIAARHALIPPSYPASPTAHFPTEIQTPPPKTNAPEPLRRPEESSALRQLQEEAELLAQATDEMRSILGEEPSPEEQGLLSVLQNTTTLGWCAANDCEKQFTELGAAIENTQENIRQEISELVQRSIIPPDQIGVLEAHKKALLSAGDAARAALANLQDASFFGKMSKLPEARAALATLDQKAKKFNASIQRIEADARGLLQNAETVNAETRALLEKLIDGEEPFTISDIKKLETLRDQSAQLRDYLDDFLTRARAGEFTLSPAVIEALNKTTDRMRALDTTLQQLDAAAAAGQSRSAARASALSLANKFAAAGLPEQAAAIRARATEVENEIRETLIAPQAKEVLARMDEVAAAREALARIQTAPEKNLSLPSGPDTTQAVVGLSEQERAQLIVNRLGFVPSIDTTPPETHTSFEEYRKRLDAIAGPAVVLTEPQQDTLVSLAQTGNRGNELLARVDATLARAQTELARGGIAAAEAPLAAIQTIQSELTQLQEESETLRTRINALGGASPEIKSKYSAVAKASATLTQQLRSMEALGSEGAAQRAFAASIARSGVASRSEIAAGKREVESQFEQRLAIHLSEARTAIKDIASAQQKVSETSLASGGALFGNEQLSGYRVVEQRVHTSPLEQELSEAATQSRRLRSAVDTAQQQLRTSYNADPLTFARNLQRSTTVFESATRSAERAGAKLPEAISEAVGLGGLTASDVVAIKQAQWQEATARRALVRAETTLKNTGVFTALFGGLTPRLNALTKAMDAHTAAVRRIDSLVQKARRNAGYTTSRYTIIECTTRCR